MTSQDIFLAPIYLILLYLFSYFIKPSITDKKTSPYFFYALSLKFIGSIFFGIIYNFYYSGGDTLNYFRSSKILTKALIEDPLVGIQILFLEAGDPVGATFKYTATMWGFASDANFFIVKLAGVLGVFSFSNYTVISLFFAALSFSGLWALYITLLKMLPKFHREFAIAIFFIPSLFFWGSGIMKDTICIGALGWLFYGFYHLSIEKKKLIFSLLIIIISGYVLKQVKTYIILCFLPAALFWIFLENSNRIKNITLRFLAKPVFIVLALPIAYYGARKVSEDSDKYTIEKLAVTAAVTSNYLERVTPTRRHLKNRTGSEYSVGKLDGSFKSMVTAAPKAVVVSLFRPYLFEVKNPVMLLSALESTCVLFFTLFVLLKVGLFRTIKTILKSPLLSFCFIFSIMFALGVGMTAGNFGTLVRYKIPLIPFYVAGLFILKELTVKRGKGITALQKFSMNSAQTMSGTKLYGG
jgi:hypothetical protein